MTRHRNKTNKHQTQDKKPKHLLVPELYRYVKRKTKLHTMGNQSSNAIYTQIVTEQSLPS